MEHQNWALPEVFQPTFAVKLNGGALGRAVVPRTDVDGTTLQYPWLASVSLGCSHQHTDPVKGKGEGIRKGPISRSVSGGRMHLDLWAKNGGGVDVPGLYLYLRRCHRCQRLGLESGVPMCCCH